MYSTGEKGSVPIVKYLEASEQTADEAFSKKETKQDAGTVWVENYLADGQWHAAQTEFWPASEAAGFKQRTMRESLRIIREKIAYEKAGNRTYIRLKVKGVEPWPAGKTLEATTPPGDQPF